MHFKFKKPTIVFLIYWFLLAYVIAALIFWFIALNRQNEKMVIYKLQQLKENSYTSSQTTLDIEQEKKRKQGQYAGEGAIFLLVIIAGAIFVYRSVKKQLELSRQQQNFMIAVTHELKTPVAISKLNLETIQKRKLEPQQQHRLMQNTLQEINRLDALCNNMLISSQIEAGGYRMIKEEFDLSMLCYKVAEEFSERFPDRKIICQIEIHPIYITADAILLQIVLSNLLENALKYSSKEQAVNINLKSENKKAIIQVIDHGPGIPVNERRKIFNKFYRLGNEATQRAKGTGLGLYLAQKIITAHKAKIIIEDNPIGGSIFMITIPTA